MGFGTPFTAVAGTAWKAADWNTYGRDNIAWIATDSPSCSIYNNAPISHTSSGSNQAVTFNSERFDNAAMHSTSSNPSRVTVPTGGGGKYLCGSTIGFAANGSGHRALTFQLNGTTPYIAVQAFVAYAGAALTNTLSTVRAMSAADYFEMLAFQNSGGALNIIDTEGSPSMFAFWYRT